MACECENYATLNLAMTVISGHNERCEQRKTDYDVLTELIARLVSGIESWGADTDGIHEDLFDSYRLAKLLVSGTFVK